MVAVVVPSPATSLVFCATAFTSLAPMFSNGSARSISLLTVTPFDLHVAAAVTAIEHFIAFGHGNGGPFATVAQLARTNRQHAAALGFFLGRVRQENAARSLLLRFQGLNHDPIIQRSNFEVF